VNLPEKAIRLVVGVSAIVLAALTFRWTGLSVGALGAVLIATALGGIAGYCLHPFISGPLSEFAGSLYFPDTRRRLREQYTAIHSMIAQGQFAEAEAQLRETLRKAPDALDGSVLLAELLHTHLQRSDEALQVALQALASRRKWEAEKERLVMLAVDICLDRNDTPRAKAILTEYARKAGRSGAAARMSERLMHLP